MRTGMARGDAGRFEVMSKTLFAGYWNSHALMLAAIRDGWFITGDIVRQGRDGHLVQLDPTIDVIRTNSGAVYRLIVEEKIS
jgi:long-chain acyl-CoA synthetase